MIKRKDIIEELLSRGYNVKPVTTFKNGVQFHGIRFITDDGICPVIYTGKMTDRYDSLSQAVDSVISLYEKGKNLATMDINTQNIKDPEFIMRNLYIGLQKESSEDVMNIIRQQTGLEGIEKYLYVKVNKNMSFKLSHSLLEALEIDEQKAWQIAQTNTFSKTQIISMKEVLSKVAWPNMGNILEFFIIKNDMDFRGASAILDTDSIKKFAKDMNVDRFITLPSSIHEMIIIPDDGTFSEYDIRTFSAMVGEVNQGYVEPQERLTDRAYVIDVTDRQLEPEEKSEIDL